MAQQYVVEHLNHLGIVAQVCREIGVAEWLDEQEPTKRQHVSVGTATVALVLNGLGFSNRQLYLVPQFFADKPVEYLLGPGITASDLNDDCLGRTLDWLYEQDVTRLFAGIVMRARQAFGVATTRRHADTTSFSVHGQYAQENTQEPSVIAVTYGYSRDHREDLKQWMLAIITSGDGVPLFLRPLDGNASDKQSLVEAVTIFTQHLKASDDEQGVYIADSGMYSAENMRVLNAAGVSWVSRVPETLTAAQQMGREESPTWQTNAEGTRHWWSRQQDTERWIAVRTLQGIARARTTMYRHAARDNEKWHKRMWHLEHQDFACAADAERALTTALQPCPAWIVVQTTMAGVATHAHRGRPRKGSAPALVWQIRATVMLNPDAVEAEALRRATFIIGTNLLDAATWPDEGVMDLYREQTVVEKGFAFLKDPLFLASSVFVKKPQRIMAIAFLMTLCLLVYKLAEYRIRQQLAATQQTVPDQVRKPTKRPTMRWLFQCFEGIDLHHTHLPDGSRITQILRLTDFHRLILHLLGAAYENCYLVFLQSAE
jgi:transposase